MYLELVRHHEEFELEFEGNAKWRETRIVSRA
jgi:hypothetical protein